MSKKFSNLYDELPDSMKTVVNYIVEELDPDQVILFGSRARQTHRTHSDFDIAVRGVRNPKNWSKVSVDLVEEPMTLFDIDLLKYEELNSDYKKSVDTEGRVLYAKDPR